MSNPSAQPRDAEPEPRWDTSLFFTEKPRVPPSCTPQGPFFRMLWPAPANSDPESQKLPKFGDPSPQVPFSCEFLHEGGPDHTQHRCSQWPRSLRAGSN